MVFNNPNSIHNYYTLLIPLTYTMYMSEGRGNEGGTEKGRERGRDRQRDREREGVRE